MNAHIKKIIAALIMLSLFKPAKAQVQFSGGLLGGISFGNVDINDVGTGFNGSIQGNNIYGFEGGVYAKLLISPFYIKPELLYNYRNGQVTYYDNGSNSSQTSNFSVHKIELPVLVGFHIIGPLNIEAGPVYNYLVAVTENYNTNNVEVGRNGLGYRVGIAFDLEKLLLGLSYQGVAYTNGSNNASFSEPYKIVLGVGIRLGSTP